MKRAIKERILIVCIALITMTGCKNEDYDSANLTLSTKTFQLNSIDNLLFTNDNGVLISGRSNDKYCLVKTDGNLHTEWIKNGFDWGNLIFGSGWGSSFYSVQIVKAFELSNGNYVCIGTITDGGDVIYSTGLVVELTKSGTQVQKFVFDNFAISNALQTADGGYILFGSGILKLDKSFNQLWTKNSYNSNFMSSQIIPTLSGGFAVTGSYNGEQVFLKKYDSNGNELLSKTYKHNEIPFEESGFNLTQLNDEGFLIIGRTGRSFVPNIIDCQILRTGAQGDTLWTKRFGYATNSWLDCIVSSLQDEFIIAGSIGFPNESQKSVVLKINSNGVITDSVSVSKFQILVHSPLDYYIKVRSNGTSNTDLLMIDGSHLFDKD